MEKVFGPLGAFSVIVGGALVLGGIFETGQPEIYQGAVLISSGLFLLAFFEIIKVLKQIRDRE